MVKHVAIILDGNRRYAKSKHLPIYKGHYAGAENVENLMRWAHELGVKELTLYSFSMQNFKRPKEQVNDLMKLFELFFNKVLKILREGKDKMIKMIKFNFIGRVHLFPLRIRKLIKELVSKTKRNSGLKVNFAFGYGGREEIIDAVKKLIKKGEKVNEKTISENLYLNSEPEIVIRTGGEQRTSNFLPWQSTYSEWFFLKKMWPAFTRNDLRRIISEYNIRERRFGA